MEVSYGGGPGIEAWIYFLLLLFLSLAITWLIIYTAVRAAVGHALDRMKPRLAVEATTTPDGVQFIVSNVGSAPAIDLVVRWLDQPYGEPLARTSYLGVNATFEWIVAAAQVPGETSSIRRMSLRWSRDPDLGSESVTRAVLVPSRLNTAG